MAGRGQRFVDAGYRVPKQFIYVERQQLMEISLDCFNMEECNLIFVVRDDQISNHNVDQLLRSRYGNDIEIVVTDGLTDGSVCSCLLADEHIDNKLPLFIHTLDIEFSPRVEPSKIVEIGSDGLLLTFKSNSANYSYVQVDNKDHVQRTAEKKVISDKACVGIYYFKNGSTFCDYARKMIELNLRTNNEFYITPLYNLLIEDGLRVKNLEVDKMHIFGTPREFEFYKDNVIKKMGYKPIALCSDHSGHTTKELFKAALKQKNIDFIDYGTTLKNDCDYKYFIEQAVTAKKDGVCDFIFGFCRTGQGVNMCANKFKGIRSALVYDQYSAEMAIRHNCANFFSFPERLYQSIQNVEKVVEILLTNSFDGGRHQVRIQGLEE
jgi:RpiB/LacA/LacB family sugar-phosphate isomerase